MSRYYSAAVTDVRLNSAKSYFRGDASRTQEDHHELRRGFQPNESILQSAFEDVGNVTDADPETAGLNGANLQALNLPNVQSFMHTSF